ncbi:MAG: methyl-accepting chemotaxis protein [Deltaproteobacteria bacterium]|nr:MAG: methyl-accepting chemotaxis protein [Deltaproteobacteria bacterium]
MRVDISYKFVMGFLLVIASVVVINMVVPFLGIVPEWRQLFTIGCAMVVGLVLGGVFSRAFTANIRRLKAAGERLGSGDLAEDVEVRAGLFPDETVDLAESLNRVQDNLRQLVGEIRAIAFRVAGSAQALSAASQETTASSQDIARTVDQISRGAETQAEMVEESNRLFKEMAVSISLVAAAARKVAGAAEETVATAERGNEQAGTSMDTILQAMAEVEESSRQIVSFIARVQKVGKIVEVINGIAHKTNMLALNAAIEAARAGEYGRGFAVVAEEVRKLADSTTDSSAEITALIEELQEEGQRLQGSLAQVAQGMQAGRTAADRTGQAFTEIHRHAGNTLAKANSIAELAEQQISGAERITRAIDEIDKVVSDNAAATEEVSAATEEQSASMLEMAQSAQELSAMSEDLLTTVKRFRLVGEQTE